MTVAPAPRGLRLSAEARGMLPWCFALVAATHVLLLVTMAPAGPRLAGLAGHLGGRAARPLVVRLVAAAAVSPDVLAAPGPSLDASGVPPASAAAADAASAASTARPSASAAAAGTGSAAVPASAQDADSSGSGDAVDGGYVPRPLLSVAPDAITPVDIATPPETEGIPGRHLGVLSLYIDEQGVVRRIEAEQPALPEAMERAARAAFMAARFSPGQVDGHVVKSRLRIEVVFDDGSEPMPTPVAASAAAASAASAPSAASVPRGAASASAAKGASAQRLP